MRDRTTRHRAYAYVIDPGCQRAWLFEISDHAASIGSRCFYGSVHAASQADALVQIDAILERVATRGMVKTRDGRGMR